MTPALTMKSSSMTTLWLPSAISTMAAQWQSLRTSEGGVLQVLWRTVLQSYSECATGTLSL